jgi:hypothetical protein
MLHKLASFESVGPEIFLDDATGNISSVANGQSTVISTPGTGANAGNDNPIVNGSAAPGSSALYSREDHVHPTDTTRAADSAVVHKTGAETVAGVKTFSSMPSIPTHTPSSATDTGIAGQVAWDASFIYVCVATNTWLRAAIATWS